MAMATPLKYPGPQPVNAFPLDFITLA